MGWGGVGWGGVGWGYSRLMKIIFGRALLPYYTYGPQSYSHLVLCIVVCAIGLYWGEVLSLAPYSGLGWGKRVFWVQ